jgi:DNA-binding NarL/FixJ family response regulator
MTRVLVVDDQFLIRAGLVGLLDAAPGFEVVGEAADGAEAVRPAARTRPDVILMDIRMPGVNGIEATERILAEAPDRAPRILILTTFDLDEYVYGALRAGACGFLPARGAAPPDLGVPTSREVEVLKLTARGLSNLEIAHRLGISEATVKTHLNRTMTKLGLDSRAQAVVIAYETGLVIPGG